ncbi:hypothetical protein PsYK624_057270 [Phanerochaete sordida]|uniref:Uncharacterized protein n=1 Tax=Phanerochaete sordida TaxID=48140 RepID=A0A9P3LCU4_9APHY|nr:hypothetical protein PsYK624_057270 [Phanerochaete sordida]
MSDKAHPQPIARMGTPIGEAKERQAMQSMAGAADPSAITVSPASDRASGFNAQKAMRGAAKYDALPCGGGRPRH